MRRDIDAGTSVLVRAKASTRHARPTYKVPERDKTLCYVECARATNAVPGLLARACRYGAFASRELADSQAELLAPYYQSVRVVVGESQRDYAIRCAEQRAIVDKAQRAWRVKAGGWGPNAWSVDPRVGSPYPPTDELPAELAEIRRKQCNERKRARQGQVVRSKTGAVTMTGPKPDGKELEARRAVYIARREIRRLARRMKRHGGPFSKRSREIVGWSERQVDRHANFGEGPK